MQFSICGTTFRFRLLRGFLSARTLTDPIGYLCMLTSRSLILASISLILVACGGGDNSPSEQPHSPAPTDPTPVDVDPALSNSRIAGAWITSSGCGFDTGRLLISESESSGFVISLLASGSKGSSTVSLYPTEISAGEYSSDGAVVYDYRAQTLSPGFLYFDPFRSGTIALAVDGDRLYMSSACAQGVDFTMMYTPEDADQSVHGARFAESARLIRDQIFQEHEDAKTELTFYLSRRGLLNSSVAERKYAELRAWYLESVQNNLGVLIDQYAVINLEHIYSISTLEDLKREDKDAFPNYPEEVEAMYDLLIVG